MMNEADSVASIIETAVHAPSGDNTQPWYFVRKENEVDVFLKPDSDNPILNFRLSGTYVAHGALIENLALAASLFGMSAEIQILPDSKNSQHTAHIRFAKQETVLDPLAKEIKNRHTNRKPYHAKKIGSKTLEVLEAASRWNGAPETVFLDDSPLIKKVGFAAALMEQVALETPALREVFFGGILWSEAKNRAGEPGLYIKTMEVPAIAAFLFKYLKYPRFAAFMVRIGFSKAARKTNAALYASAPLFSLVTFQDETPNSYIAAGRTSQRIWLAATQQGLACQPVTGLFFLARSIEHHSAQQLLPEHFSPITEAASTIADAFGLTKTQIPGMMFRMGYATPATALSSRHHPDIRHASGNHT